MTDQRPEDEGTTDDRDASSPVQNPFDESPRRDRSEKPVLISSKRSAALLGVATGLILLILVVAFCVVLSYALG
ncbi:MAG: hypothetical protein ACOC9Y_08360 [Chloroflexota bacterium]